jgi:hypothetical protein
MRSYPLYNKLYFTLGRGSNGLGEILPSLIEVANLLQARQRGREKLKEQR